MSDTIKTDWHGVADFAKKNWPYLAVGGVVLVGILYTLGGNSSATAATTATTPTSSTTDDYAAALQAQSADASTQAQLDAAQITAAAQVQLGTIQANAQTDQANAAAASSAYIANTTAQTQVANYAVAASQGQTIQALNSLASAFGSYAGSIAQTSAADATAAAGVAQNNDLTASRTIGATLQGIASVVGAFETGAAYCRTCHPVSVGSCRVSPLRSRRIRFPIRPPPSRRSRARCNQASPPRTTHGDVMVSLSFRPFLLPSHRAAHTIFTMAVESGVIEGLLVPCLLLLAVVVASVLLHRLMMSAKDKAQRKPAAKGTYATSSLDATEYKLVMDWLDAQKTQPKMNATKAMMFFLYHHPSIHKKLNVNTVRFWLRELKAGRRPDASKRRTKGGGQPRVLSPAFLKEVEKTVLDLCNCKEQMNARLCRSAAKKVLGRKTELGVFAFPQERSLFLQQKALHKPFMSRPTWQRFLCRSEPCRSRRHSGCATEVGKEQENIADHLQRPAVGEDGKE